MGAVDAVDRDRLVRTFLELVAIGSPTGHEERIGEELERRFAAAGASVTRDHAGNLVATVAGTRDETFLVSTHMDTAGTDVGIRPVIGDDGVIRTDGSTILGADDKSAPRIVVVHPRSSWTGSGCKARRASSSCRCASRAAPRASRSSGMPGAE